MSRLIIHLPGGHQQALDLSPGSPVTLGRAEDNTVRIDEDTVSRHHARLRVGEDGACVVEDLGSANGVTVNGQAVERFELQDGDRLSFGEVGAKYQLAEADAAQLAVENPSAGQVFAGRYRLESALGETDEYRNFLAADLSPEPLRLSLKVFAPEAVAQAGGFERAWQEFARTHAIPTHPHLIRLLDFGRWRGASFLAAEWVEGYPLLDLLRRHRALSCVEALSLAREAAAAADHVRAHALPAPDLNPRATLLAFDSPTTVPDRERLLDEPLKRWPPCSLKVPPRLFAARTPSRCPLGELICELLGHPLTTPEKTRDIRIASLGEQGSAKLAAGFASAGEAFGGGVAFVDALAKDAGVALLRRQG